MPWKETGAVDERVRLIADVNKGDKTLSELCRGFGISRKTAYKWIARYEEFGPEGLMQRISVAHQNPHATPDALVTALIELRKGRPTWGPKKLKVRLEELGVAAPAASTIGVFDHRTDALGLRSVEPKRPDRGLQPLDWRPIYPGSVLEQGD